MTNQKYPACDTPVLFIIFNRPDTTQRVFDTIRQAKPKQLFVAADGPRPNKQGESELCQQTRDIIKQVDWDCEVKTLFREENLSCGRGVSSAITWFFENVEAGIILEDDIIVHPSFFPYCTELLERYRHDTRIMMISGLNFLQTWHSHRHDYFYSTLPSIWGWASWRRAWMYYDYDIRLWANPEARNAVHAIPSIGHTKKRRCSLYTKICMHGGDVCGSWDFQWAFAMYINSGLAITPAENLVENVGFTEQSTHTSILFHSMPTIKDGLPVPLRHNPIVSADREYDLRSTKFTQLTWGRKLHTFLFTNQKRAMLKGFVNRVILKK